MTVPPVGAGTSTIVAAESSLQTPESLAQRWSVSPRTVRKLAAAGKLHGSLIGRYWRFSAEQVAEYERRAEAVAS